MKIKPAVLSTDEREQLIERALQEYDREQISLGRLAELLGTDYQTAIEFVLSRGMQLRFGPQDRAELLRDLDTLRNLSTKANSSGNSGT